MDVLKYHPFLIRRANPVKCDRGLKSFVHFFIITFLLFFVHPLLFKIFRKTLNDQLQICGGR